MQRDRETGTSQNIKEFYLGDRTIIVENNTSVTECLARFAPLVDKPIQLRIHTKSGSLGGLVGTLSGRVPNHLITDGEIANIHKSGALDIRNASYVSWISSGALDQVLQIRLQTSLNASEIRKLIRHKILPEMQISCRPLHASLRVGPDYYQEVLAREEKLRETIIEFGLSLVSNEERKAAINSLLENVPELKEKIESDLKKATIPQTGEVDFDSLSKELKYLIDFFIWYHRH